MGFVLERNLKPDYYYTRRGLRFSKQSQRKRVSGCPEGMTELEWASYRGLARVYDAGKRRWILNLWPGIHETRNDLFSKKCAKQHENGVFNHSHLRGYYWSEKNKCSIYYASSYELRCLFLLENDSNVASFCRCDAFKGEDGWRNPDLLVGFSDGRSEVWEIKPEGMLSKDVVQAQIEESKRFAKSRGEKFRLWTERDSGFDSYHSIISWAKEFLVSIGQTEWSEKQKKGRRKIRRRYYERNISSKKVEVWCDFCQDSHSLLKLTYDRNMKKNGRFICIRENGHMVGKRGKDHLRKTNPYETEGKKQCTKCLEIKPMDAFSIRRASYDGLSPSCKDCCKKLRDASKKVRESSH
jgi:hypothetical protein